MLGSCAPSRMSRERRRLLDGMEGAFLHARPLLAGALTRMQGEIAQASKSLSIGPTGQNCPKH